jgi:hypothetical protein
MPLGRASPFAFPPVLAAAARRFAPGFEDLPLTGTGKIRRHVLREMVLARI